MINSHSAFNTPPEVCLKICAILEAIAPTHIGLDAICALDYLIVHTSDLDNAPPSIHPDTPDHHEEAFVRRDLIGQSIRIACAKGLLHLDYQPTGIKYGLGMRGSMFLGAVHVVYVTKLRQRAAWLARRFINNMESGPTQEVARIKPNHSHHFAYYGPSGGANS